MSQKANASVADNADVRRLNVFERYLTLWVAICMIAGIAMGKLAPGLIGALRGMEFGAGRHGPGGLHHQPGGHRPQVRAAMLLWRIAMT